MLKTSRIGRSGGLRPHLPCLLLHSAHRNFGGRLLTHTKKKQPLAHRPSLTMADLAELAGVSKITVSRALSESPLVNVETRERVQALARKHGYKLNVSARNLRLRRSHTVAVIVEMKPSSGRTNVGSVPRFPCSAVFHRS